MRRKASLVNTITLEIFCEEMEIIVLIIKRKVVVEEIEYEKKFVLVAKDKNLHEEFKKFQDN